MFVVATDGLAPIQWAYSIAISFSVLFVNLILKCVPDKCSPYLGQDSVYNEKFGVPKHEAEAKAAEEAEAEKGQ